MTTVKAGVVFLFLSVFGAAMAGAAETPSPALLVLDKTDNSLVIVDPVGLKSVGRVPAGEDPHEVVVSDDGKIAYISNYGAYGRPAPLRSISVVDLIAQRALPPIDLGALGAPHGLAMSGGKLYFTAEANKVIGSYDPVTRKIDWLLGTGQDRTHMVAVSNERMVTTNVNSATASIIERGETPNAPAGRGPAPVDWHVTNVPVGRGAEGFDISPDGKTAWVANAQDRTVSIIDIASKKVTQTLTVSAGGANRLKFTPDGKLVFISDPRGSDLVVIDAATRQETRKIAVGQGGGGILMVPDGSRAFVALGQENVVVVVDLRSLTVTGRIQTGRNPDGLAWAVRK